MSNFLNRKTKKTPWHLWLVGIIGLLWSAIGAMDFVMTQMRHDAYMSAFSAEELAFFYGIPLWAVITWGIAVWGGVIGSLFLLMRKMFAVWTFFASLLGLLLTAFQNYILSNGMEAMGDFGLIITGVIFVTSLGLYLYARSMGQKGLLN